MIFLEQGGSRLSHGIASNVLVAGREVFKYLMLGYHHQFSTSLGFPSGTQVIKRACI